MYNPVTHVQNRDVSQQKDVIYKKTVVSMTTVARQLRIHKQ